MSTCKDHPRANVLGIGVDAVDMEQALVRIEEELQLKRKGYVCLVGVHGVMEAQRDAAIANIFRNAALALPDGMPTVWVGRHQGHVNMERVAGPDLMLEVMRGERFRNATHFLCGGKDGVAEELREQLMSRYPFLKIVGTYTPPFGPMSLKQEKEFVTMIGNARPSIVWVGISTPKQDRFMNHYLPLLDTTLMFGVGAAFDFHTGRISDCPEWIKQAGLQWFDRLLQDPRHLWKRYLRNNPAFLFYSLLQLTGLRSYPLQSETERRAMAQPAGLLR
ncbi:WecB/TagA/CpsF family glycosyltransferase [Granulicella sp. dw_53]|uniref:WecB/TagA/CpsF family glycosyltransferase n=1 Tax=Granulicella sp. dw_53 TaxID=2719792 RepID=UPI001BD5FF05|nr:WecB/TagA/CpsF family glycosyltransferase [Granulicella sp. dw_53]